MSKRQTKRQKLKADPCNQRTQRLKAWAVRHGFGAAMLGVRHAPGPEPHTQQVNQRVWYDIWWRFDMARRRAERKAERSAKKAVLPEVEKPFVTIRIGQCRGP